MIAIFYGPTLAVNNPAPAALDFTTQSSRDYTTISPLLQQAFYVGTGVNSSGQQQSIVVPPGATNMVLAPMDGYQWIIATAGHSDRHTQQILEVKADGGFPAK